MMRIKRIMLAATVIATTLNIPAYAAETDWVCKRYGNVNTNNETHLAEKTQDYYFDDNASLLVKYPNTPVSGNYLEVKAKPNAEMVSGNYTLTFYALGDQSKYTTVSVSDFLEMNLGSGSTCTITKNIVGADGRKWTKYEQSFEYEDQSDDFISFKFSGNTSIMAIDGASLVLDETEDNLISDGGFENFAGEVVDYDEEKADTIYPDAELPKAVYSTFSTSRVIFSWRNPEDVSDLKGISVYRMDSNTLEWVLLTDELPKNAGQLNTYVASSGTEVFWQFKIVFEYKNKADRTYYTTVKASGAWGDVRTDVWNAYYYRGGSEGKLDCPAKVFIDKYVTYENSGASLCVQSNIDSTKPEFRSDVYFMLEQGGLQLETGKRYELSMYIKGENVQENVLCSISGQKFEDGTDYISNSAGTYDWKQVKLLYTHNAGGNIRIRMTTPAEKFWVDNISLREIDESNIPIGENIIADGDFEIAGAIPVGQIKNVKAVGADRGVTLSWQTPSENYKGVHLYQKFGDTYEFIGHISPDFESFTVDGLDYGKTYNFKIIPINNQYKEGIATEVTAKTLTPKNVIEGPALYKDNVVVSGISGSGTYSIITNVKNNLFSNGLPVDQLVAVYDGNKMISLNSTKKTIKRGTLGASGIDVNTTFSIPDSREYTVKVFLMDNRNDSNLYKHCVEFN